MIFEIKRLFLKDDKIMFSNPDWVVKDEKIILISVAASYQNQYNRIRQDGTSQKRKAYN
jgi:hypothetical protein